MGKCVEPLWKTSMRRLLKARWTAFKTIRRTKKTLNQGVSIDKGHTDILSRAPCKRVSRARRTLGNRKAAVGDPIGMEKWRRTCIASLKVSPVKHLLAVFWSQSILYARGLLVAGSCGKTMQMCPLQRRGRSMLTYDLCLIQAGLRHTAIPLFGMARKRMSMSKLCVRVCRRDLRPGTPANSN
jgi:hypothetical protein